MFSVGEDGALFMFKVADKEGRGLKRDKEIVFSEEILITKSDLEEKVRITHKPTFAVTCMYVHNQCLKFQSLSCVLRASLLTPCPLLCTEHTHV